MLDMNRPLLLEDSIVLRGLGDKYWALNTSSGNQYRLNDVSYFILNLLRIQMSTAQVVDEILREYEVTREQAVIDCGKLLQFAIENAIVKEVEKTRKRSTKLLKLFRRKRCSSLKRYGKTLVRAIGALDVPTVIVIDSA